LVVPSLQSPDKLHGMTQVKTDLGDWSRSIVNRKIDKTTTCFFSCSVSMGTCSWIISVSVCSSVTTPKHTIFFPIDFMAFCFRPLRELDFGSTWLRRVKIRKNQKD
jgi:hypothetical protein